MTSSRTSIIILCFNALEEATRPCIESIYRNTPSNDFELVVIDNGSSDGTAAFLRDCSTRYPNIKIQINENNKGYAGGNNDGLRLAEGRHLVLLNNDTLVPPGWLDRLIWLLDSNRSIGMVGPVTNSAGNEQRVTLKGLVEKNYEALSYDYIVKNQDIWFPTQRLGFFCVAMRREVYDKVGMLDENFGIGMFEDDDYCVRVLAHGYKLAVTEGCFVYHKGSISFSKMQDAKYHELFTKNKRYFVTKHNLDWALTDIAFAYLNKFERELLSFSKHELGNPEIERLVTRIDNFKHLLVQVKESELSNKLESYTPQLAENSWRALRRRITTFKKDFIFGSMQERSSLIKKALRFVYLKFAVKLGWNKRIQLRRLKKLLPYSKGQKVVIFPATVDFDYMTQRPQHLARAFSKAGFLVIYGTLNHSKDKVEYIERKFENLFVFNQLYFMHLREILSKNDCFYYCMWPTNLIHTEYLPYHKLIYDYMDELELLEMEKGLANRNHNILVHQADVITTSSQALYDKIPTAFRPKTLLLPNAVSSEFLAAIQTCTQLAAEIAHLKSTKKKIVGYYGAIATWFDFELISYLANQNLNFEFVFIGPIFDVKSQVESLRNAHTNVHFFSMVPHERLVEYLNGFDIAIIPFVKNNITDAVSPLKLFEYMGAGIPIISTELNECQNFAGVYIARSYEEFSSYLDNSESGWSENLRSIQIKTAFENSWDERISTILTKISEG